MDMDVNNDNDNNVNRTGGLLPFQSAFLHDDLAVIPEDLREQETLMSEVSRRESQATLDGLIASARSKRLSNTGLQTFASEKSPRNLLHDDKGSNQKPVATEESCGDSEAAERAAGLENLKILQVIGLQKEREFGLDHKVSEDKSELNGKEKG